MSVFPTLRSLTLLAAVALSLMGCKQGDGEVCDVVGDCETGLVCCGGGTSGLPLRRGICQPPGDMCVVVDAGPGRDSGPELDGGPGPDGGPTDAGGDDAGTVDAGTDAGTVEDGGTDAGTVEDAGSDAGDAS